MLVSKEFLEALVRVSLCASQDATRYTLGFARVRRLVGGSVEVVATDGHRLVIVNLAQDAVTQGLKQGATVLVDVGKAAVSQYKLDIKSGLPVFEFPVKFIAPEGVQFPDVDAVTREPVAMPHDSALSVSFNAEYLEEMLRALREDKKSTAVRLVFKEKRDADGNLSIDRTAPIRVSVGGNIGVLMPVRG